MSWSVAGPERTLRGPPGVETDAPVIPAAAGTVPTRTAPAVSAVDAATRMRMSYTPIHRECTN